MTARDILHLSIPAFPVALARLSDPSLRGRPVAVRSGPSERSVVACASVEAEREGVRAGMSIRSARRACRSLRFLPPDPSRTAAGMDELLSLASRFSPLLEPSSPGQLFLDLTGSRRLLGHGRDAAVRLEQEVSDRLSLTGTVGIAGNKLVSRIAARSLPGPGICDVLRGSEGAFIAPLPVTVLPGVGRERATLLRDLCLARVEQVAALTATQLHPVFGPFAPLLLLRARGIDHSPVQPSRAAPEVAEESRLAWEENDDLVLRAELFRLAEGCGFSLRRLGLSARRITLRLTYADGAAEKGSRLLPLPVRDDLALFAVAEGLFLSACRRRVRVSVLRLACGDLSRESCQEILFPPVGPSPAALQGVLDRVREKYGREALRWGRTIRQG